MTTGPAVVLLHGQPGSALQWHRVVESLPAGIQVLAEDRPGYGDNTHAATGLFGNADALVRRLDDLGIERAVIIGHSWAGGAALAMAERHPDRVQGLVLLSSIGPGAINRLDRGLMVPGFGHIVSWVVFHISGPLVRRRLTAELPAGAAGFVGPPSRAARRGHWRTFLVEQRRMVRELPALIAGLPSITVPTVVVTGSADRVVAPTVAAALAEAIPQAELRTVDGAGHALPLTNPEAVVAVIAELMTVAAAPVATTPTPATAGALATTPTAAALPPIPNSLQ